MARNGMSEREAARLGARKRWPTPRLVRLDRLPDEEAWQVFRLVAAKIAMHELAREAGVE
jgi:hypothetical protein